MLKLRILPFLFVIACCAWATGLEAQRSLYQDAIALSKNEPRGSAFDGLKLTLRNTVGREGEAAVWWKAKFDYNDNGEMEPQPFPANKLKRQYLREITLTFQYTVPGDELIIEFGDSREIIDVSTMGENHFVQNDSSATNPQPGEIYLRAPYNAFSKKYDKWMPAAYFGRITPPNEEPRPWATDLYIYPIDYAHYKTTEARLDAYASLFDRNDFRITYGYRTSIYDKTFFAGNPFFQPKELLPEREVYSEMRYYDPPQVQLPDTDHNEVFPYQKVLDGNTFQTDETLVVAVDEVTSYRQRIVTAQTQLDQANSAFEKQRKKGGLLDVNTVAVGLSDFIAERAQEELNLTFFNRFKENLAKDSELTVLFPATRDLLNKFEISNYKVFLAHARETFNADLDNLGVNLSGILNLPKYRQLKDDPNVYNLALIYDIANAVYQEKTVEEIVLNTHTALVERQRNLNESINLAIADSLYAGSSIAQDGIPVFPFREKVTAYLKEVEQVALNLNNSVAAFYEPTKDPLFLIFQDKFTTPEAVMNWYQPYLKLPEDKVTERRELENNSSVEANNHYNWAMNLTAQDGAYIGIYSSGGQNTKMTHHGRPLYFSYMEYSKNLIGSYLEGHDFYGYYFEKEEFTREHLQSVPVKESTDFLASGLEKTREFLEVPYDDYTLNHYQKVVEMKERLVVESQQKADQVEATFVTQVKELRDAAGAQLLARMNEEMDLLQKMINKPIKTDRYLVALELLRLEFADRVDNGFKVITESRKEAIADTVTVTKAGVVAKAIELLDAYEQEWDELLQIARDNFADRLSKTGTVQLNPDYEQNKRAPRFLLSDARSGQLTISMATAGDIFRPSQEYLDLRNQIDAMKTSSILGFEKVDELLAQNHNEVIRLGQIRRQLIYELDSLTNIVAPNLIKARRNAEELAKGIEIASHVLFAFRDYSQEYDTLFYRDTQRVEVTVQRTDPKDGLVRIFKKDSLLINLTPVPGTTEPLQVAKWITRRQFDDLRKNERTWKIFLGLLYERLNHVEGGSKFAPGSVATLATQFLNIANEIQEIQDELRFKKGTDPKSVGVKEYFPFIRSTVDLLINKRASALGKITEISNETLSLYENIDVREYGNAILNATELLRIITNRDYTQEELASMGKDERKRRMRTQRQVAAIFKYGTFMAEMINAKSSDQVKTILKSTTLPPGSSRIKREVQSNVTINSYLGAGLGRDRLLDAPMDIDADAFGAALSVPIGITYSFSPKFLRNRSSFSLHVPLLDLGAITAYRSNPNGQTTNVDALPELEWKNLFSPGAYLIYNFADSPFSLGIGGQYGPQLRELNQANGEPVFLNSFRFPMISATIDVPFYNLHTGPRKIVVK